MIPHYETKDIGKGITITTVGATPAERVARTVASQAGINESMLSPAYLGDSPAIAIYDRNLTGEWTEQWDQHLAFLVAYTGQPENPLRGTAKEFHVYGPKVSIDLQTMVEVALSEQRRKG